MEPFSASFITALGFVGSFAQSELGKKFIEGIVGGLGEKVLEAGLEKVNALKQAIVAKFQGNSRAETAIAKVEQGDQQAFQTLAACLQFEMDDDQEFAAELRQMAQQVVNIGKVEGQNVQNNFGGENYQTNNPKAPTFQGGSGNTITINYGKD